MPTEAEVMAALSQVVDPELPRTIVEMGMVRGVRIDGGAVEVELALTTGGCPLSHKIAADVKAAVGALPGVEQVTVVMGEMTAEERKAAFENARLTTPSATQFNRIDRVLAVVSGKGGVGKSSVAGLIAVALARRGRRIGILDADVTGPSIPRLFGLRPGAVRGSPMGIIPAVATGGIKVMSVNLLLPEEDRAVIWRGPLIANVIQQFWTEVVWGRLDYLLVDMPPGTSDAALTVMQQIPLEGAIVVTTPQDLAGMVVRKAVSMLTQLQVPILGVVENMSYFECPDTGKRHEIFGPSHAAEVAAAAGAPVLARLPIDPELARLSDSGRIVAYNGPLLAELGRALEAPAASPGLVPAGDTQRAR